MRDGAKWRLYRDPTEVLIATDPQSLKQALARVERHAQEGGEAAGVLRYEAGYAAYLNVLDAQRSLNIAQLALIRNRQALLSASVDLMKALGGGWQDEQPLAK